MNIEAENQFSTELRAILDRANTNQRSISTKAIVSSPRIAALASKLVTPKEYRHSSIHGTSHEQDQNVGMLLSDVQQISNSTAARVEDNENVFKLFPDIELCAQILITSIQSPKDMVRTELIFRLENNRFSPAVSSKFIEIIREEIEGHYKLKDRLYDIIREALFMSGSYPIATIPEAAIDHVINSPRITTESIFNDSRIFGADKVTVASEGILGDPRAERTSMSVLEAARNTQHGITTSFSYNEKVYVDTNIVKEIFDSTPEDDRIFDNYETAVKCMEQLVSEVAVNDNKQLLKLPKLIDGFNSSKIVAQEQHRRLSKVCEAVDFGKTKAEDKPRITSKQVASSIYKNAQQDYMPYFSIPSSYNLKRKSIGRPLELALPAESLVPVHVPGDYRKHVGYYCVLDADGVPVTFQNIEDEFGQGVRGFMQSNKQNQPISSLLTERAKKNLISDNYTPVLKQMAEIYADVIEKDCMERLSRGIYAGKELKISKENDIFRVMFFRSLRGRFTRILYIPAEYVTYFSFNYHRNGVGKSYLDELSNLTSLRAMVLFSKVWAQVRSSIAVTDVNIEFDPKDRDPLKTIEMIKHLVARSRQQIFPNGLRRVADFTDWIQRAGIQIQFSGHPRLPETKIGFESRNTEHAQPNSELEQDLRHMTYMHFGLSPEMVDNAAQSDFATAVENNSILFSRRVTMLSNILSEDLSAYARKTIMNDEVILQRIVEVLIDCKDQIISMLDEKEKELYDSGDTVGFTMYIIELLVNTLIVDLPKPQATTSAATKEAIDEHEQLVDKVMESIISSDVLPAEFAGDVNQYVDSIKASFKAWMMRQYFADNNILPEAFEIANIDDDGKPMLDLLEMISGHIKGVQASTINLLQRLKASKAAAEKDIQAITGGNDEFTASSGSSDSSDTTSTGDDSDLFGDLSIGDDLTEQPIEGGEVPVEEGNPEEAKPDDTAEPSI